MILTFEACLAGDDLDLFGVDFLADFGILKLSLN